MIFPWMSNFSQVLLENRTSTAYWKSSTVIGLGISVTVILLNTATLLCFLTDARLRVRPFSIYLISLVLSNLLFALLQGPVDVILRLSSQLWLEQLLCFSYHYSMFFVSGIQMFSHVLITINRGWAVTFPFSYQRMHTRKLALTLCAAVWTTVHSVQLPFFLPTMMNLRTPLQVYRCQEQYHPPVILQLSIYLVAWGIVVGAYPFVVYRHCQAKGTRELNISLEVSSTGRSPMRQDNGEEQSDLSRSSPVRVAVSYRFKKESAHTFMVLTLLTSSTLIFWTPGVFTYTINSIAPISDPVLFEVVLIIFTMQSILDPLLFTLAIRDLRSSFTNLGRCFNRWKYSGMAYSIYITHCDQESVEIVGSLGCLVPSADSRFTLKLGRSTGDQRVPVCRWIGRFWYQSVLHMRHGGRTNVEPGFLFRSDFHAGSNCK